MLYHEVACHRQLRHLIKCFWVLDHSYADSFHDHERLWANAHTELIFSTGHRYFRRAGGRVSHVPGNFVIGPFQSDLQLYSRGRISLVAARFWPWGFHALSRVPMPTLKNAVLRTYRILGAGMEQLGKQLATIDDLGDRVAMLEQALSHTVAMIDGPNLDSRPLAKDILDARGVIRTGEIARRWHIHPRRMERLFLEQIGVSPKVFARIVRFNHAKRLIEQDPATDLLSLAHDCGYADQSHFTRNFREMFGITPAEFRSRVKAMMQQFRHETHDVVFVQDTPEQG